MDLFIHCEPYPQTTKLQHGQNFRPDSQHTSWYKNTGAASTSVTAPLEQLFTTRLYHLSAAQGANRKVNHSGTGNTTNGPMTTITRV